MTAKQQPWLISYEYEVSFARGNDGGSRSTGPHKEVLLIDQPPWKFIAESKIRWASAYRAPYQKDGTRLPDRILAVYWAVQIPQNGLTDAEMDALS